MKNNFSNMMNLVSAIRVKVLCLATLSLFVGANNEVWGQTPMVNKKDQKMTYVSNGVDTLWTDAANWNPSGSNNATGFFPGQRLFVNNPYGNFGGGMVTVNTKITMPNMSSYYYAGDRNMQDPSFDTIFNIQSLTLKGSADLTLYDDLFLTGSGADPVYDYQNGTLKIMDGASLIACKTFKLSKNQEITGGGKLILFNKISGTGKTLTADIDVEITPKYDNPAKIEHNTLGDAISINVLRTLSITRQTDVTKNNIKLEFANIVVKPNATVTINNNLNGKQTVSSSTFTMEGGTLDIAAGSKLSVTGGDRVLTVTGDAVLKGTGTLDVLKINIADDATLTIDGTRTFNGIEFTGGGKLKIANGKTLTLKNTKFNKNITVLKAEAEGGMSAGNLVIEGYLEGNVGSYPGGSTLTTEVNTELKSGGDFTNIDTIDIKGGTFTNNRISGIEKIKVAEGAKLSTLALEVTTEVELLGTLDNGDITLTGDKITFGSGTGFESGTTVTINSGSGAATINGLGNCFTGHITLNDDQAITYNNSTCILSANYSSLTFNGTAAALCGDAVVDGGFTLSQNVTISGSADDDLTLNGAITGDKDITINGAAVNVVAGAGAVGVGKFTVEEGGKLIYGRGTDLTNLSVDHESAIEFGESIELTNPTLGGSVTLADGVSLTLTNNVTFGANTEIDYGTGSSVNISDNAVIDSLRSCELGLTFVVAKPTITYNENSTCILGGTYTALTIKSNTATLCDNVTVENGFGLTNNISITSSSKSLTLEGAVTGGKVITATSTTITVSDDDDTFAGGFVMNNGSALTVSRECTLDTLAVNGGSATLGAETTVAGITAANSGTININESVTVNHSFAVSGGTVSIGATTGITQDFTVMGGTVAISAATTAGGDATLNGTINLSGANATLTVGGSGKTVTFGSNTSISDGTKLTIVNGSTINGLADCIAGIDLDDKDIIYGSQSIVIQPANYNSLQINGDITLCNGNVTVSGLLTWNGGNIILNNRDLILNGSIGGNTTFSKDHMVIVGSNGSAQGHLIRGGFSGLSDYTFPVGTKRGSTLQFAQIIINADDFAKENDANPASISVTSTNAIDMAIGSVLNLKRSWDIEVDNITGFTNAEITFQYDDSDTDTHDFDALARNNVTLDNGVTFPDGVNQIVASELSEIAGHWTAIDNGVPLYSVKNHTGNWNDGTTWTTDPNGEDDGDDVTIPTSGNNVIILETSTVNVNIDNAEAKMVGIYGTLNKGTRSFDGFTIVFGTGTLEVDGEFIPANDDVNYSVFFSEEGGTVELKGDFRNQSYFGFNNLALNNANGEVETFDPSGANILGDLIIRGGDMVFNGTGAIAVGDSIRVESGQTLTFSTARDITAGAIDAKNGNVVFGGNVIITDSVNLAGTHFNINSGNTLTLGDGTKYKSNATIGAGTVVLTSGKDLKGTLTIDSLQLSGAATVSGEVNVEKKLKIPSTVTITGNGLLSVKGSFTDGVITTYTNIKIATSNTGIGGASFVVNDGATLTIDRGGSNINGLLTINNGGTVSALRSTSFDTLVMNGETAKLEAFADVTLKKLTGDNKHYLSGTVETNGNSQIKFLGHIDFGGIEHLKGKFTNTNANNNIRITNLKQCFTDQYTFSASNNVTYIDNCDYMLSGDYQKLIIESANIYLCDTVVVNGDFVPSVNTTLRGNAERKALIIKGDVANANRTVSFDKVNIELGGIDKTITASEFNVSAGDTLSIAGNIGLARNILFGGTGIIRINENCILSSNAGKEVTFSDGQIIEGEGTLEINGNIDGGKLITKADVEILGGSNSVDEYEVRGKTFTNSNSSDIEKLTVFSGATFKAAENTSVGTLTVNNGGTIVIADGKTLTASSDNLKVSGAATISSEGSSNIVAANVELAASSNLTINRTITFNNPLQITHASDTITAGEDAVLAWTSDIARKISVAAGKKLTIGGTLTIGSDFTIDGAMVIGDNKHATTDILKLGGGNVTFTNKTDFTGTSGQICFTRTEGVTIKSLQVDPKVESAHLEYMGTVTYDAACTSMLPGVYPALTLNTLEARNISMFDNVTVDGELDWDEGRIALNGKELTIGELYSVEDFDAGHMVLAGDNGKLVYKEKTGSDDRQVVFPVGTLTYGQMGEIMYIYSPVEAKELEMAVGDIIKVGVTGESLSGSSSDLCRYWTIDAADDMGGELTLHYDDADDVKGYGKSDGHFWKVFVGDTVFNTETPSSPFSNNQIVITTTSINGTWTAVEYPVITTLYSFNTGRWNDPSTWTTISTGNEWVNPGSLPQAGVYYDFVILGSDSISAGDDNRILARSITLKGQDTKLVITKDCEVDVNNLTGVGMLILQDRGDFPHIADTKEFMSSRGGTTVFSGTPDDSGYELQQLTFNNLAIRYDKNNVLLTLPEDKQRLSVNGDLEIENGALVYTAISQAIHVEGNVDIKTKGKILTTVGAGAYNKADTLQVRGNMYNRGTVKLTNRVWNDYGTEARSPEGLKGRGILRFVGESNNRLECYSTTNISQLIIDKGVDATYKLTLYSEGEEDFGLLGYAINDVMPDGFAQGVPYPADPDIYYKPLWIKCGTLELTGDVHIRSLAEFKDKQYDCAYIPASGCLYLNGANVEVDVTISSAKSVPWTSVIPAGKLIIEQGLFDGKGSSGITFVGTSYIEVKGHGKLKIATFRPSNFAANGTTTFILSDEGEVTVTGDGDANSGKEAKNALFSMPEPTYTFNMTGGTLELQTALPGGAFVVKSNPLNGEISGGKIILNTGGAWKSLTDDVSVGNYLIASELPLYDLVLKNENNDESNKTYVKHYIDNKEPVVASTVIKHDLTIDSDVIFDTNGKTITIGGSLIVNSGAKVYTKNSEFVMTGTGNITINGAIENSSTDNTPGFNNLTIAENAKIKFDNGVDVRGKFTLAEGAEMRDNANTNIYTMYADSEFDGTYVREETGAGKIVIKGSKILSTGTGKVNNLEINTGSELKLEHPANSGTSTTLTVTGKLDFASNTRFNIGSSNLILDEKSSVVATGGEFGNERMILTVGSSARGVTRVYSEASNNFTFPFGIQSNGIYYYTPAYIGYSAADVYGSITSLPISGYAFRTTESLGCYWKNSSTGFENPGTMTFVGKWFSDGLTRGSVPTLYEAGRKPLAGDWDRYGTASVNVAGRVDCPEERYMQIVDEVDASGYYSCGVNGAFVDCTQLYTSRVAEETGVVNWNDPNSWSREECGEPAGVTPGTTTAVQIGGNGKHHKVVITENSKTCASLNIMPGSTLDLGTTNNHNFQIIEVDEAIGAGTLELASANFPKGDFGKFLGTNGGTVKYYVKDGNDGYTIPNNSEENSISLANYCNLIVGGYAADKRITMPNQNVTVYRNFTVEGWAKSCSYEARTVTIDSNMVIKNDVAREVANGGFSFWEDGSRKRVQTYKVLGNVIVAEDAELTVGGEKSPASTSNKLEIGGDLKVDGLFCAQNESCVFNTVFRGANNAKIYGSTASDIMFNTLECNKDNASAKLILATYKIKSATEGRAHPNGYLMTFTRGALEVDFDNPEDAITLTKKADFTIPAEGSLSIVSGKVLVTQETDATNLKLSGQLIIESQGSLAVGSSGYNCLAYAPYGRPTVIINGGSLTVAGQICRQDGQTIGNLVWEQNGGNVEVKAAGRTSWRAQRGAFEILNTGIGSFTMRGGTLKINNGGGVDTYGDIYIVPTESECTGGTIIVGGGNQKLQTSIPLCHLKVNTGSSVAVYNYNITLDSLTIDGTGVFDAQAHNVTIHKAFANRNNQSDDLVNKTSRGYVTGSSDQITRFEGNTSIECIGDFSTQFGMLEIDGDLTLKPGCSKIRVAKDLNQESGTVTDNGNVISLYGDLWYEGVFDGTGGIDFCNKDVKQTIHGSENDVRRLGTIIISNPNEVWLNTSIHVTRSIRLGSSLYSGLHRIVLDENAVITDKDGSSGFSSTRMIRLNGEHEDGGIAKYIKNGPSSFVLPIGIVDNGVRHYTPAAYNFTVNPYDGALIRVKTINFKHRNISETPSKWLNYYWSVDAEGFEETSNDVADNCNFNVTQTYTFTDGKVDGDDTKTMLPEFLYFKGVDYKWAELGDHAEIDGNQIIFNNFGHISGDYTAGVVGTSTIYTGLPALYSRKSGEWNSADTWEKLIDENADPSLPESWVVSSTAPNGNPIHIRPGDTVTVTEVLRSYCLYFDNTNRDGSASTELGVLDIGSVQGCSFGPVMGAGWLCMKPNAERQYKMPAGGFDEFLRDERTVVEFGGGDGFLPTSTIGHVSLPLQNVVLSGSGIKTLTREDGEYINGDMIIRNGTTLRFNNTPIHIKGNWIDYNKTTSGFDGGNSDSKSLVEFNGTAQQQKLSVANDQTAFWKLKINNPNGVVFVKNDSALVSTAQVRIGKELILGNGDLTSSDTVYPVMASAATITGAGAGSYINGPIGRLMGNDNFTFPVGGGDEYAPITVVEPKPKVAGELWIITYHNSDAYASTSCDPTLTKACQTEYWTVSAPNGATSKLRIRVNDHSFGGIDNTNLKRVKIVGLNNAETLWSLINSSHVAGTSLPQAMVLTSGQVTFSNHKAYSLGFAGATANLMVADGAMNQNYYICDGDNEDYDGDGSPDKIEVPIYFKGIGGPYRVTYSVNLNGVSKNVVKNVTVDNNNVGLLTFTGHELGAMFDQTEGYNTHPYNIKLVSVYEDGDLAIISVRDNTASLYVMYNAVPEITGARYVGMRDVRRYTTDEDVAVIDGGYSPKNPYTWEVLDGDYSSKVSVADGESLTSHETKFSFDQNTAEYDVTLRMTKVYKAIKDGTSTCSRWADKTVSVKNKPQPRIHSVTTGDVYAACTGSEYVYETERIEGHNYVWTVAGGSKTVEPSAPNICKVIWSSGPAKIKVVESVTFDDDPVEGADSTEIQLHEGISIGAGQNTLADNSYACDRTYGSVIIGNSNGALTYTLYSGTTALSESKTGKTGEEISLQTKRQLLYDDATSIDYYVLVENIGCRDTIKEKSIILRQKPILKEVPEVSSSDLYVNNLAVIDGEVLESGSALIDSYDFVYSSEGVTYDSGETPENWQKDFANYDRVTKNKLKVRVPYADRFKGSLNVYKTYPEIECSSSYEINAGIISHDYLWRGSDDDWNQGYNWWPGVKPTGTNNVVVRSGKYISDGIGASDSEDMKTPQLSENTSVRNVKIVSGEIKVDDYTLTINGDVDCAGKFTGAGTVRFTNAEHTVSGSSVEFANLTNEGTVTANSNLAVKGNLTNSGSFVGTDTVKLSGTSAQAIRGTGSFTNLTISNTGSGVNAEDNVNIEGAMTMNSGLLRLANGKQVVFGANGQMVKTGNSWVVGEVKKTWASGNTTPFTFVVGSENRLGMVGVRPTDGGSTFTASYAYTEHAEPITEGMPDGMTRVSGVETWNIHGEKPSSEPQPSYLTLYWADYDGSGITDMADGLVIAHKIGSNWEMIDNVTVDFTGKNIKMNSPVTSYSDFTFGTKNTDPDIHPLPVTFTAFSGRQEGNSIVLEWATMSEKDNDYFEIERSIDGVNFVTIGYVDGAGDSDRRIDYTFSDNAPESGYCYYRLSQVDFDGTRAYADKVISVQYTGDEVAQLTIVPNPTDGRFRVSATGSMAGGVVQLLSQTGNVVRTVNVDSFDATLDISDLPSGIYLLRFVTDSKILQQKVVKY